MKRSTRFALLCALLLAALLAGCAPQAAATAVTQAAAASQAAAAPTPSPTPAGFDGQRAMQDVEYQMALGPRTPGSQAHEQVIAWMRSELEKSGWTVEMQEVTRMGHPVRNVIAKRGSGSPWTIVGAHFDSRMKADHDPDPAKRSQPVPAANDGASGVAVMLELARALPANLHGQVWLFFIDAEDQGEIPGWDWTLGSQALADSLTTQPDAVVILDMIGDADLNIYRERNSTPALTKSIWDTAASLGYDKYFIAQDKYSMLDDHTPFLQKGIHAVDIIDFDYPYWHTTQDTADKVSAHSLLVVGDSMLHWLEKQ